MISIILDGEEFVLQPSSYAAFAISRHAGGFVSAAERVLRFDRDMIAGAIALGLAMDPQAVEDKIERSSMADLMPAVSDFIQVLANGGKPIEDEAPAKHWAAPGVH
jgi:hypothetical protein